MTWNDTASSNLNCGPPLSAVKGCPSSSKATTITDPAGYGQPARHPGNGW
jgi:hypothetical protein